MVPPESALGLPLGALRPLAVLALAAAAVAGLVIALAPEPGGGRRLGGRSALGIAVAGLLARALMSVVQDGGLYDVFDAYHIVGGHLLGGRDVFVEPALGLANYPPVIYWWWALASAVPADHPHLYAALVRLPFWAADAAIGPALLLLLARGGGATGGAGDRAESAAAAPAWASRAAWLYTLSPVAIAVPTLHGQFDPLVVLPLLIAVAWLGRRPLTAGLLVGLAVAIKPWPLFFIVPLLAMLPRRHWRRFLAGVAAVPLSTFAAYGAVHPAHLLAGIYRVATYVAHRQGLGTSLLLPEHASVGVITAMNLVAGVASSAAGLVAARRRRPAAEVLAVAMVVLLALSPTVSDQYLMWPLPFLLLAGRLRTAALLGAGLLPAVISLDLWTSQNGGETPFVLLAVATLTLAAAAGVLLCERDVAPARLRAAERAAARR